MEEETSKQRGQCIALEKCSLNGVLTGHTSTPSQGDPRAGPALGLVWNARYRNQETAFTERLLYVRHWAVTTISLKHQKSLIQKHGAFLLHPGRCLLPDLMSRHVCFPAYLTVEWVCGHGKREKAVICELLSSSTWLGKGGTERNAWVDRKCGAGPREAWALKLFLWDNCL